MDENTKTNAWRFVDLVFTGKYRTEQQVKNLKKLVNCLIDDYETALPYIDIDIKSLIYDTVNGTNADLQRRLENCYNSLYYEHNAEGGLPFYLTELKNLIYSEKKDTDLIKKLYNHVVKSYKTIYGNINKTNFTRKIDDLGLEIKSISKETEIKIVKEIYPQFITILGIFTAITFAIFGGMNLLSNLFQNMRSTHASLGQALILVSVFGFTLWGLIEILFIWISKINLTKDNKIDKDDKKEKKIDKKEKIFNWSALSFLTVILILGFRLFFF